MNKFYVRTPKAEIEGSNLSTDLKRMLTYMEGYLASDELAKRAPPSLRENWKVLLKQLLDGGYIVAIQEAKADRRATRREAPVTDAAAPAKDTHHHRTPAATSTPAIEIDLNFIKKTEVTSVVPEKPKQAPAAAPIIAAQIHQPAQAKTAVKQHTETQPNVAQRIRNLEIENESLMKLLTDAYIEIEKLKATHGPKK